MTINRKYCASCGHLIESAELEIEQNSLLSLEEQLKSYLKNFEDNIKKIVIKYDSENKPVEASINISILTGNGVKGPFSYYPPDEFIAEIWENKEYVVSYHGQMHYYPQDCACCAHRNCQDCPLVEVGAKWIIAEKTVQFSKDEQTFDQIAAKLLAHI